MQISISSPLFLSSHLSFVKMLALLGCQNVGFAWFSNSVVRVCSNGNICQYLVNCVLESAYYFTNLASAKSFIVEVNAKSLSLDAIEFEESVRAASLDSKVSQVQALRAQTGHGPPTRMRCMETNIDGRSNYPYMEAEPGELTVEDAERFLGLYKDVVTKYTHLCRAVWHPSATRTERSHHEMKFYSNLRDNCK